MEKVVGYGETLTIDTDSRLNAIERAKAWASKQELHDGSWLQVTFNGVECSTMKPGEF